MKSIIRSVRAGVLFLLVCCSPVVHLDAAPSAASQPPSSACAGPPYHQFDFWIGHWVVSDVGNPAVVARARIDSILDGCVLREDYQAVDGHAGQSFTIYDASRNVWYQTWVTNGGTLLEIEGKFDHGEMTLSGKNQKGEIVRGTWKPVSGAVHETAVKSGDDGKTWEPWFDIAFRRAPAQDQEGDTKIDGSTGDQDHDRQTLATLDAQYQEAVKRNDAATMGRILSDDFALVTSSGKTYSKADLLEEAKSSRITYEHQEDTDKTVRLWGDMAIVTAKLWEKGTDNGKPFEYTLWFSDVYRRTPSGWRYVFAQSAYRPPEPNP